MTHRSAQIPLFKQLPRPPRPRFGNRAAEFRLQCALADLLRRFINPGWKWTHLPFGEYRPPATAARLKRMGVQPGWPDLIFISRGRICFLELKSTGGTLSKEQAALATHLMMCGAGYLMTSDFADAVYQLRDWGVLPDTVRP